MKHVLLVVTVACGALSFACGGPDKPPMTPDSPDVTMTDAGTGSDTPNPATPVSPTTPSSK